jgi:hypothetical protein
MPMHPNASPAHAAISSTTSAPATPDSTLAPKTTPHAGRQHAPEDERRARHRRRDQPVEEAALDVERGGDADRHAAQQQGLRDRGRQLEGEERGRLGKARKLPRLAEAADVHGQEQRREDHERHQELRAPEGVADRAPGQRDGRPYHAASAGSIAGSSPDAAPSR